MKRILAVLLAAVMVMSMTACGKKPEETTPAETTTQAETTTPAETTTAAPENTAMTHDEYIAAEMDSEVVVETYVQANQSWWDGKISVYAQSEDGAYFIYNMACESQEEADKLVPGTKIRVTGYKSEWSGEVEIIDATYEIIDGSYVAEPVDVTNMLGSDELIEHQNEKVMFTNMTVEPIGDGEAFLYKWDGSGAQGDDLYFNVSYMGQIYNFTVESYLCGMETEVYQAIEGLQIGDNVDLEGFLYWYAGANPHITSAVVTPEVKGEGVMTYEEYNSAGVDEPVVVETYVQANQDWWEGKITLYTADKDGAYFIYELACESQEEADKLVPGTKIKVTGYKSEWAGEVEITDATYEIEEGFYVAPAIDLTGMFGGEELVNYMNKKFSVKGYTVADSNGAAFLYKWDGSGSDGDDLYFNVTNAEGETFNFTVESYLCGAGSEVYEAVKTLAVGDVIDMEGFLYWYNGANPHITMVCPAE